METYIIVYILPFRFCFLFLDIFLFFPDLLFVERDGQKMRERERERERLRTLIPGVPLNLYVHSLSIFTIKHTLPHNRQTHIHREENIEIQRETWRRGGWREGERQSEKNRDSKHKCRKTEDWETRVSGVLTWKGGNHIWQHLDQQFHRAQSNQCYTLICLVLHDTWLYMYVIFMFISRYALICLVFFHTHPEGKKSVGYMMNVSWYTSVEGDKDMIYDYMYTLDLCLYIVARDHHENWDQTCHTLSVLGLLTETERQHHTTSHIWETLVFYILHLQMYVYKQCERDNHENWSRTCRTLVFPCTPWVLSLTDLTHPSYSVLLLSWVLGFCLFGVIILPTHMHEGTFEKRSLPLPWGDLCLVPNTNVVTQKDEQHIHVNLVSS